MKTTRKQRRSTKTTAKGRKSLQAAGNRRNYRSTDLPKDSFRTHVVPEIEKMEKQLSRLAQRLYAHEMGGYRIQPMHPWIIVRVLPKEQITAGGIWLADKQQNKPVYEGIVLETWLPYNEFREYKCESCGHKHFYVVHHECGVKVGQRIAFPHFEGQPHPYLDDKYYRMVREGTDQNKYPYCGVLGTVDYKGDKQLAEKIGKLMKGFSSITTSGSGGYQV